MKTNLFIPIKTEKQAKEYIKDLFDNGELYHFEDNAKDIVWDCSKPTNKELMLLDINRNKLFAVLNDPFEYIMELSGQKPLE